MIRFTSITLLLISFTLGQSRMATVSGNVYLSDQTADHSGVKVFLRLLHLLRQRTVRFQP